MDIKKFFLNAKEHWHVCLLLVVIFGAILLRGYHFNDWLVFKSDQARDLAYAQEVLDDGLGRLRLMGPKIEVAYIEGDKNQRGDSLHLGPAYYYIQTAAAYLLGGAEPWKLAFPELILSVLSIPIFYCFLLQNFSKGISFLVTTLFAFGFFLTQYGRFSWNPNALIFWEIIFALALFKSVSGSNRKISGIWLIVVAFSFGVASQLHVIALFSFPLISAIFWFLHRPKANLKYWAGAVLVMLVLYIPVFVYECKNNGDNTKRLIASLQRERDEDSGIIKSVRKSIQRHGEFVSATLTTFHNREIKQIETAGGWFYLASVFSIFLAYANSRLQIVKRIKRQYKDVSTNPNIFLGLVLTWSLTIFIIFIKLVGDLNRVRYFMVISPIIYVFLAFWFGKVYEFFKKKTADAIVVFVFLLVLLSNVWAIAYFYKSLGKGALAKEMMRSPKMNYYDDLITLGDIRGGLEYMVDDSKGDKKDVCFRLYDYQYKSVYNLLGRINYPEMIIENFNPDDLIQNCNFYAVVRTEKAERDIDSDLWKSFKFADKKTFDFITVYKLEYKTEVAQLLGIKGKHISENEERYDDDLRVTTWGEVFN